MCICKFPTPTHLPTKHPSLSSRPLLLKFPSQIEKTQNGFKQHARQGAKKNNPQSLHNEFCVTVMGAKGGSLSAASKFKKIPFLIYFLSDILLQWEPGTRYSKQSRYSGLWPLPSTRHLPVQTPHSLDILGTFRQSVGQTVLGTSSLKHSMTNDH